VLTHAAIDSQRANGENLLDRVMSDGPSSKLDLKHGQRCRRDKGAEQKVIAFCDGVEKCAKMCARIQKDGNYPMDGQCCMYDEALEAKEKHTCQYFVKSEAIEATAGNVDRDPDKVYAANVE